MSSVVFSQSALGDFVKATLTIKPLENKGWLPNFVFGPDCVTEHRFRLNSIDAKFPYEVKEKEQDVTSLTVLTESEQNWLQYL